MINNQSVYFWSAILCITLLFNSAPSHSYRLEVDPYYFKESLEARYSRTKLAISKQANISKIVKCDNARALVANNRCHPGIIGKERYGGTHHAAPYEAMFSRNWIDKIQRIGMFLTNNPDTLYEILVPITDIIDGDMLWNEWARLAKDNKIIDGVLFTESFVQSTTKIDKIVSVCEADKDGSLIIFRGRCTPIGAEINGVRWGLAEPIEVAMGGQSAPDFEVRINFSKTAKNTTKDFQRALQRAFEGLPWLLSAKSQRNFFSAWSDRRSSTIIPNYREDVSIRAELDWSEYDSILTVSFYSFFYVNRLATTRAEDWHLPTQEIRNKYTSAIRSSIRLAVDNLCPSVEWENIEYANCGKK